MRILFATLVFLAFASISVASEPFDYSRIWKDWGREGQDAYIWGVMDGSGKAMITLIMEKSSADKAHKKYLEGLYERIRLNSAIMHNETKLIEVMSSLYRDPANSYVSMQDMLYIARDSISGKDVSKRILEARKFAIDNTRFDERRKNQ